MFFYEEAVSDKAFLYGHSIATNGASKEFNVLLILDCTELAIRLDSAPASS